MPCKLFVILYFARTTQSYTQVTRIRFWCFRQTLQLSFYYPPPLCQIIPGYSRGQAKIYPRIYKIAWVYLCPRIYFGLALNIPPQARLYVLHKHSFFNAQSSYTLITTKQKIDEYGTTSGISQDGAWVRSLMTKCDIAMKFDSQCCGQYTLPAFVPRLSLKSKWLMDVEYTHQNTIIQLRQR